MDAFNESAFILVGDSGEQDLELYLSIARARPLQVSAILIRDITSAHRYGQTISAMSTDARIDLRHPQGLHTRDSTSVPLLRQSSAGEGIHEDYLGMTAGEQKMLRRVALWETRMERAKSEIPHSVVLKFFTDVEEIEDWAIDLVETHVRK